LGQGGTILISDVDDYDVEIRTTQGIPRRIRGTPERVAITKELAAQALRVETDRVAELARRAADTSGEMAHLLKNLQAASTWLGHGVNLQIVGDLIDSDDGHVLVRRQDLESPLAPDGPVRWDVLSASGAIIGWFSMPGTVRLKALRWPFVYGTVTSGNVAFLRWRINAS
jgi:hypothetical protein